MDWGAIEICRALNLDRYEFVDGKSTSMDQDSVENLSARQKVSWWIKKLSRQIPKSSMDRDCANFCQERKKEGLDRCKSVEKPSSLKKTSFSKRGKTHRNECIKLLKHRSNQHVKILKTSFNKKMQIIQRSNTHTHITQV